MESSMEVSQKLKMEIPYDPAITLLAYPKECTPRCDRATCTSMIIAPPRIKLCCLQVNGWNWRTSC
jgi:hypothetical protein